MLKRILNYLFPVKIEPLVGEWFILGRDDKDNPFVQDIDYAARIKAIKLGYILYSIPPFDGLDYSRPIKEFLRLYRSATQEEAELLTNKYL